MSRHLAIEPRHIPHYLDERHIQPLTSLIPQWHVERRVLHRFAAITAIRSATRLSVNAATAALDLPPGWGNTATATIRRWARRTGTEPEIAAAMQAVIDALNSIPPTIDYQRRRKALTGWLIPADVWDTAVEPLRHQPRAVADFGPRKRHAASLLLWVMITNGDYLAAPLFRHRMTTEPRDHRFGQLARRLMFEHSVGEPTNPRYRQVFDLIHVLAPYRAELEKSIDNAGTARSYRPTA